MSTYESDHVAQRDAVRRLLGRAPLDTMDRHLIEALQADGRRSTADLARELRVTTKTIRRRVERLLESGVIQITAVTTPEALGYRAIALVGVELDGSRTAAELADGFAQLQAVDYVAITTGRYPIYVELFCRDAHELGQLVDRHIHTAHGVRSAEVFPYLRLHYQQAQFAAARSKADSTDGVRPVDLSALDRAIIGHLTEDGRKPFLQIARDLNISEGQVRLRVRQLADRGVARVMAIANPLGLGYTTTAWIAIGVETTRSATSVADELSALPDVTYVAICAGRFDIFAEVACTSTNELLELLERDIRTITGVNRVETSIYLDLHYKRLLPLGTTAGLMQGLDPLARYQPLPHISQPTST